VVTRKPRPPAPDVQRQHLLAELKQINRSLRRLNIDPYIDPEAAEILPLRNLKTIVNACADHLSTVHHQLSGIA
jgi:hypothetical protein